MFEQKFGFPVVVFCSHAAISLRFLLFFRFFGSDFVLNGFPNPFIVHSRSRFLVNENSLNCKSGLVLLCFCICLGLFGHNCLWSSFLGPFF